MKAVCNGREGKKQELRLRLRRFRIERGSNSVR